MLAKPVIEYAELFGQVKSWIRQAQIKAILSANREMIRLYWNIGHLVLLRQDARGWGASVIPRLARDIHKEFPHLKGFSERNIGYMIRFAREYPILHQPAAKLLSDPNGRILQQPVAKLLGSSAPDKLGQLTLQLPWGHNVLLIEKVKDLDTRLWYMLQTLGNGWSRNILAMMIDSQAHNRQGKAITNFASQLPPEQSDLAVQVLKDPYIFDFLTLTEPLQEKELETQLLRHLEKFLIELGQGFAFVGRQYHMEIEEEDFYIDLLFYHLHLRSFIVIDLKTGPFKAEYAGKMNLYLNLIDDQLRHPTDSPSIGLILCQNRNRVVAEYALRGMKKPIGISKYELTRALPKELQSSLPSIEQIEAEFAAEKSNARTTKPKKKQPRRKQRNQ